MGRGAVAFVVTLAIAAGAPSVVRADAPFVRGDANRDGKVTFADVFAILGQVFRGVPTACPDAADADDSGDLTASDAITVLTLYLDDATVVGLPAPYPEAGEDPSDDALGCFVRRGVEPDDDDAGLADAADADAADADAADADAADPQAPIAALATPCELAGVGAELEFIHFRPQEIFVFPGQKQVSVTVFLGTFVGALEGISLSFDADPSLLTLEELKFRADFLAEHATASSWVRSHEHARASGHLGATIGFDVQSGAQTLAETPNLPIAELVFSVRESARIGLRTRVGFGPIPAAGARPSLPTELVRNGESHPHGQCPLSVRVVPREIVFLRGDTDRDGRVTLSDALAITQALFVGGPRAPTLSCLDAADADDNGRVDFPDAVLLLRHLFLRGSPPLPPYPHWGLDPALPEDSLGCEEAD